MEQKDAKERAVSSRIRVGKAKEEVEKLELRLQA